MPENNALRRVESIAKLHAAVIEFAETWNIAVSGIDAKALINAAALIRSMPRIQATLFLCGALKAELEMAMESLTPKVVATDSEPETPKGPGETIQ